MGAAAAPITNDADEPVIRGAKRESILVRLPAEDVRAPRDAARRHLEWPLYTQGSLLSGACLQLI